uniref:Uncharacterized protein n=1 Tax=Trichuris muris TaxID=70415 RepID=A0A5S6QTA0_TRIMR
MGDLIDGANRANSGPVADGTTSTDTPLKSPAFDNVSYSWRATVNHRPSLVKGSRTTMLPKQLPPFFNPKNATRQLDKFQPCLDEQIIPPLYNKRRSWTDHITSPRIFAWQYPPQLAQPFDQAIGHHTVPLRFDQQQAGVQ